MYENVIASVVGQTLMKSASDISISKRPVPKDERKNMFSYKELEKEYWSDIWQKAKEHFNISFDWENNDPAKEETPKIITIKRKSEDKVDEDSEDIFQVRCQLWYAGGDWEYPSIYFRCQLIENSFYGLGSMKTYLGDFGEYSNSHVILIPPIEAGNTHLYKTDDGKFAAIHSTEVNDDEVEELDPKKAWQWLEQYFLKMIKDHIAGKNISRNE